MSEFSESRGVSSKKTFCIRELYKEITKERPGAQSVRTDRRKSKIFPLPVRLLKILPVLNVKPPQIPNSSELFSKSGMVIRTFQGQNESKVMLLPRFIKNQNNFHSGYKKKLDKSYTYVKSENRLQNKLSLKQNKHFCPSFLNKTSTIQVKTKEKLQTLQELILNDGSLSGWEAS